MKNISLKFVLVCAILLAGLLQAGQLETFVVIVNESVPAESLGTAALKDVYTGKTTYWDDGQTVVIAVLADKTDAAIKEVSGMDASQFKTFWQRMVFSGRGHQPKKLEDADALVAWVAATKGAIAIVPAETALKGVKILEVK